LEDLKEDVEDEAVFTVHLGDFNTPGDTDCELDHFRNVRDILAEGPLPTFVLAGDNDSLDCPDKDKAWDNYIDTFVGFEDDAWNLDLNVNRRSGGSSSPGGGEMFSFYEQRILFISMALMNKSSSESSSAFSGRLSASKDWVEENLQDYANDDVRGVVLFSHAEMNSDFNGFFGDLEDLFADVGFGDVSVLYMCGDRHRYRTFRGAYGWDQLDYISVDKGGCAAPLLVEVAPEGESFFSGSSVFGDGLFRVDRRGGRYSSCN